MEDKSGGAVSEFEAQASQAVVVFDEDGDRPAVGFGEEGSGPTGSEVALKRRRGRPRKYDVDGSMVDPISQPPGFSSSLSQSQSPSKRGPGRPRGSGKLQLLTSLGGIAEDTAGGSFTPHVVTVLAGEDIFNKVSSFSQRSPRAVCILSATGVVSSVTICQPGSSGGILRYEGRFEILSLSGSYIFGEMGGVRRKNGMLSVSLAKPDGKVFGGRVAGSLIAAEPIQLIAGSFKQNMSKEFKKKHSAESSTAASIHCISDLVSVPVHIAKMPDGDDSCATSTSELLEPVRGAVGILAANENLNPASSLHRVGQNSSQSLQPMSDQRTSPEINVSLPQI